MAKQATIDDLARLANDCTEVLSRCCIGEAKLINRDIQCRALALSILSLRLESWKQHLPSLSSSRKQHQKSSGFEAEAVRHLVREILDDLYDAERRSFVQIAGGGAKRQDADESSSEAIAAQIRALTLQSRQTASDPSSAKSWFPTDQKHADRLIESLTEKTDSLVQLTFGQQYLESSRSDRVSPSSLDAVSAFWLGVAAANTAENSLRKELERYSAENVEGFSVIQDAKDAAAGATMLHQGHVYNEIQAEGNAKMVMGDQYGGSYILDQ